MIQKINVGTISNPQPELCFSICNKLQDEDYKVRRDKVWETEWNWWK